MSRLLFWPSTLHKLFLLGNGSSSSVDLNSIFTRTNQTMALGVWSATDSANAFETWLGKAVDLVDKHADRSSFSNMASSISSFGTFNSSASQAIVWSIPMVASVMTSRDSTAMTAAASGTYDANYATIAQTVLSSHNKTTGSILIRIGWEQNGNWQPWAAQDSTTGTEYITVYRKMVNIFRSVSNRFKFIWCPNQGQSNPDLSWPGKAYVDLIGMDVYYNAGTNSGDGTGYFNFIKTDTYGLDWLVAKGTTESLPICIPEWGIKASQGANVGNGNTATETSSQAAYVTLFSDWMRSNNIFYSTYWDSNFDIDTQLSNNQYPLTGTRFKIELGEPSVTSSSTANLNGDSTTTFSLSLTSDPPASFSISNNADGFTLNGSTLQLPAQTWVNGGDNTRNVTIGVVDSRGLTSTQNFTLTIVQPITDLYPTYDFAFDPVNNFYKVGNEISNSLTNFLNFSSITYSADPTAGFSGSGYLADDTYSLKITIPSTSSLSLYSTASRPANTGGTYHCLLNAVNAGETSTRCGIYRDGFSFNWRSTVRNGGATVGTDTNFGAMTDPDSIAMTISPTQVKYYVGGALARTESTTVFASKPISLIYIGDGTGSDPRWNANIKLILGRYSTDSDATASAMT